MSATKCAITTKNILRQLIKLRDELRAIRDSICILRNKLCSILPPVVVTRKILSWDCGLRTSSWSLIYVRYRINPITRMPLPVLYTDIDLIKYGTIDFLCGSNVRDVPECTWFNLIKSGLEKHAPKIDSDTIVAIENQPQNHYGIITRGNTSTQYSIAYHYSDNKSVFIEAKKKNTIGAISPEAVKKLPHVTHKTWRKKHTRLNFELFMLMRYNKTFGRGSQKNMKLRDVSDSFMQGIWYAIQDDLLL